jgi:hypothetical protein
MRSRLKDNGQPTCSRSGSTGAVGPGPRALPRVGRGLAPPPSAGLWFGALGCALILAACGSSGGTGHNQSAEVGSRQSQALAYTQCMRSRGVPNFPDPTVSGGSISFNFESSSGINQSSPSFQAAQQACGKLLPGSSPGSAKPSAATRAQMLAIADCMRAHAVTGFPDPTTSPPSNPAGYSGVLTRNGVSFVIPSTIDIQSPAVQQAASACHLGGLGQGGSGST